MGMPLQAVKGVFFPVAILSSCRFRACYGVGTPRDCPWADTQFVPPTMPFSLHMRIVAKRPVSVWHPTCPGALVYPPVSQTQETQESVCVQFIDEVCLSGSQAVLSLRRLLSAPALFSTPLGLNPCSPVRPKLTKGIDGSQERRPYIRLHGSGTPHALLGELNLSVYEHFPLSVSIHATLFTCRCDAKVRYHRPSCPLFAPHKHRN